MIEPDLKLAREFVDSQSFSGKAILVGITGSHHYGFPSPDSDIDIKGIHQIPASKYLGLDTPDETFDRTEIFEGIECDTTLHEIRKALSLLLRGNGNMLERIFSPYQLYSSVNVEILRTLAVETLSQECFKHYSGYLKGCMREFGVHKEPRAKPLLYCYRVACTGAHLLKTGEVEANLSRLAPIYGFPEAQELIDKKIKTKELLVIDQDEADFHQSKWPDLEDLLRRALEDSCLPKLPKERALFDAWLCSIRKNGLHELR